MTARKSGALQVYLETSRRLSVSLTFIVPLVISYEAGLLATGAGRENAVGLFIFKWPLQQLFGPDAFLVLNGLLMIAFLVAFIRVERQGKVGGETYLGMLVESSIYAGLLGILAALLPGLLTALSIASHHAELQPFLLAIGAGVYEELFFRLLLLGGVLWLLERHTDVEWRWAALAALVVSSTAFSAVHYIGSVSDRDVFSPTGFAFRYLAGVLLGLIYLQRGLGIAVYTHALYDVLVILRQVVDRTG